MINISSIFGEKYVNQRISSIGISLFRIVFFTVLLLEVFQISYFRSLIFDIGPDETYQNVMISFALALWIVSIVFVITGFFTGTFKFISYLFQIVFFSGITRTTFEYHHDHILLILAFLSLFLPLSKRFSIDSIIREVKGTFNTSSYSVPLGYALILVLGAGGITYFDSVLTKVDSQIWYSGLGVWWIPSRPYSTWLNNSFILNYELLMKFLCYLTIFFEIIMVFLIWSKLGRVISLIIGAGMHIVIIFTIPIPLFAMGMLSFYFLLVPDSWYKFIFGKYYDSPIQLPLAFKSLAERLAKKLNPDLKSYSLLNVSFKQKKTLLLVGIIFLISNQSLIMLRYHLPQDILKRYDVVFSKVAKGQSLIHLFTGMKDHPVVSDATHRFYNYMVLFEYESEAGEIERFPQYGEDGLYNIFYSGRTYRNYTFNIGGRTISKEKINLGINWIKFICSKRGYDLENGKINILSKYISTPENWEEDFLTKQSSKPWEKVGEIKFHDMNNWDIIFLENLQFE